MHGSEGLAVAEQLAVVIGAESARRLMQAFAGRTIHVPRTSKGAHPIAAVIGDEKAQLFCDGFRGERLTFPVTLAKRRRVLDLKAAGRTNGQIAAEVMVSERTVYRVLAEQRDRRQDQFRLFG